MRTISKLVEKATKMLNENREILPFTSCIEMLDFCDNTIRHFSPDTTTAEEVNAVTYYLSAAVSYMTSVIDDYHRQNNPDPQQPATKPAGKANTKAEKMLPVIR
jgi:hypothetical protein